MSDDLEKIKEKVVKDNKERTVCEILDKLCKIWSNNWVIHSMVRNLDSNDFLGGLNKNQKDRILCSLVAFKVELERILMDVHRSIERLKK